MINRNVRILALGVMLCVAGCATVPTGPSVLVLPATGKPFEVFQVEDTTCRQWAGQQVGIPPQEMVNLNTASGAAVGTLIGAGLGAAIGAAAGDPGTGAAIGAGSGLLLGTASGAESGRYYGAEAQRRYDHAYLQCMYAKGNQIPGVVRRTRRVRSYPPPPPSNYDLERRYAPAPSP